MKKSLIALAVLGSVSTFASAQSSVTLFGIVDVAARSLTNDDTRYMLASGGMGTSRLGFRGIEDLGGGLKAGFWLEGQVNVDTGTGAASDGGQNWQRRATASLIGGFGELRLGRDETPQWKQWVGFDPFGATGLGASSNLFLENSATTSNSTTGITYAVLARASNSIGYILPGGLGGIFGQAMAAAGEGTAGQKHLAGRLGWASGPFMVAGTYSQTEVNFNDDGDQWTVGGSFDMGFAKLSGMYAETDVKEVTQKNWFVGATVPLGAVTLKGSYGSVKNVFLRQFDNGDATQIAVGLQYDLSKRTALYATYSTIDNDNTGFRVGSGPTLTTGNDSDGYDFGIRHSF